MPLNGPRRVSAPIVTPSAPPRRSKARGCATLESTIVSPAPAPVTIRSALSITAPGVKLPAASSIASPATAWSTAYWIVEQGADALVQSPLSAEPPSST
jgi:hypothetical protein